MQEFFHQQYDYLRNQLASLTSAQLSDQLLLCSTFPSAKRSYLAQRSYLAHLLITRHLVKHVKLSYVPFALVANVLFFLVSRHPLTFLNGHENCDHCATSWRAQNIPQKSSLQKVSGFDPVQKKKNQFLHLSTPKKPTKHPLTPKTKTNSHVYPCMAYSLFTYMNGLNLWSILGYKWI